MVDSGDGGNSFGQTIKILKLIVLKYLMIKDHEDWENSKERSSQPKVFCKKICS